MRPLVIGLAGAAFVVWSLIAWAMHALVQAAGNVAALNSDLLPVPPEWVVFLSEIFSGAGGIGATLVVVIWGFGTALIVGAAALGLAIARRAGRGDRRITIFPPGSGPGPGMPGTRGHHRVDWRRGNWESVAISLLRRLRNR
ncbi:hypothetical protein [Chthonobacter rhizosphaerae]|uniref:hypothetical protein n=1 Tax=Chthonobacter rhizosphaerae TaxID=2735553 RepID=UPI0015EF02F3|nr:hypothetical protein [Chthonobacter rhizosphaerae]